MGVSIPDEFRPDMAMPGEWEVTEERIIGEDSDKKVEATAMGIHKRPLEEVDEDAVEAKKMRWGSRYRTHSEQQDDGDLDTLLSNIVRPPLSKTGVKERIKEEAEPDIKDEAKVVQLLLEPVEEAATTTDAQVPPSIKREPFDGTNPVLPLEAVATEHAIEEAGSAVVFKKRNKKAFRQK
jgi:hypothetical protein